MLTAHLEVVPGVAYTLYCTLGSDPLCAQSYNADGTPKQSYVIGAGMSAYIPTDYGVLTLTSEGECAWRIVPLSTLMGGEEGTGTLKGDKGDEGKSAYEVAVAQGFVGTVAEWLASLKGDKGDKGDKGASAYELAVDDGWTGSEAAWLASLKGDKGDAAALDTELMDDWLRSIQYPSTDLGVDNAEFSWLQLASKWTRYGNLFAIGIMCRDSDSTTMTTEPRYLGIWEMGETADEWLPVGVSTAAATQVVGQKTEWYFDNVRLTGKPIRLCLMMTAEQSWEETHKFAARITPDSTCGSQASVDGSLYPWLPQMTLTYAAPADRIAHAEDLQAHIDDEDCHLSTADREKLNNLSSSGSGDTSGLSGHLSDTTIHITEEERERWNSSADIADGTALSEHLGDTTAHITEDEHSALAAVVDHGPFGDSSKGLHMGVELDSHGASSASFGTLAISEGHSSAAFGNVSFATGDCSAAFGSGTRATGKGSIAVGSGAQSYADGSTSIGANAVNYDEATVLLQTSSYQDDSLHMNVSTSLYLIGEGSSLANEYCGGEAGLGYITRQYSTDDSGNSTSTIIARGTRKLSALLTDNTDSFEPATS